MARERAAATAAATAILSAVAALLVYPPRSGSACSSRLPAEEAMRAIAAGLLRQPWPEGERLANILLAERRPQLFSVRGSVLAEIPCFGWNASALAARGDDVWLSAWRAPPDREWGTAAWPKWPCAQQPVRPSSAPDTHPLSTYLGLRVERALTAWTPTVRLRLRRSVPRPKSPVPPAPAVPGAAELVFQQLPAIPSILAIALYVVPCRRGGVRAGARARGAVRTLKARHARAGHLAGRGLG